MNISEYKWESTIRELYKELKLLEDERLLLRGIDQKILLGHDINDARQGIEVTFIDTLEKFTKMHNLKEPVLCYVYLGHKLSLMNDKYNNGKYPKDLKPWPELNDIENMLIKKNGSSRNRVGHFISP